MSTAQPPRPKLPRRSRSAKRAGVASPDGTDLAVIAAAAHALWASATWRAAIRRRLLDWYRRHARDLPWRRTRDPYRVWVSEIMLQQTVVAAVVPYFHRFVERFPTLTALADSSEHDVLRYWEGLGYYRRARQLHKAARVIRDEHAGIFPRDAAVVRRLPGIGRYTAGAILSIAFDAREPILEANTVRLLARLTAFAGETHSAAGQALLWEAAERLLPRRHAGAFNQALMEVGSQICVPRQPRCDDCPLATLCPTRRWNLAERIPAPRDRPQIEAVREVAVVIRRGERVLLVERAPTERWAGLWDFPRFTPSPDNEVPINRQIRTAIAAQTGLRVRAGKHLTSIEHSVTRFRITLDCYDATFVAEADSPPALRKSRWVKPAEFGEYPLSTPARRLARFVAAASPATSRSRK